MFVEECTYLNKIWRAKKNTVAIYEDIKSVFTKSSTPIC